MGLIFVAQTLDATGVLFRGDGFQVVCPEGELPSRHRLTQELYVMAAFQLN